METTFCFPAEAPLHVGTVSLVVRDLARVAEFYKSVIGLREIARSGQVLRLGAGERAFLDLVHEPAAILASIRSAGLFHTAFLMPNRPDLGRWLKHVAAIRMPIQGASDHGVSEAVYLADPEGNGVEVYADRPFAQWPRTNGAVEMATDRLDVDDLIAASGNKSFDRAPDGTLVGHIHLQVGSVDDADRFYRGVIRLDPVVRSPSATFLSTGGYHHHVAANIWNSRGALPREPGITGLQGFELIARDEAAFEAVEASIVSSGYLATRRNGSLRLADPYNVGVVITHS